MFTVETFFLAEIVISTAYFMTTNENMQMGCSLKTTVYLKQELLMRSLVTAHTIPLYVMPEVLNRASSVFLDSPVKRLCRNYLKCEFVILNPSQCVTLSEAKGLGFGSG